MTKYAQIDSFDFEEGRILAKKYEILQKLGEGWEGEVYLIRELNTNIERAGKFFYPKRNINNKSLIRYAKILHKLQHCPIVIHYHNQEEINFKRQRVPFLVSEFVEGELLTEFIKRQPGKRMHSFQAIHLLYALVRGMEDIHRLKLYHGDLQAENIIIKRFGLGFELKLLDMYHWGATIQEDIHDEICDMIQIFYKSIGGKKHYVKQPKIVKEICCGLKRSLIIKKFRSSGKLREFLENMEWE